MQDAADGMPPTASARSGQHPGSAMWRAEVVRDGDADEAISDGDSSAGGGNTAPWVACVSGERGIRPHEATILRAAGVWFGCGRPHHDPGSCSETRCPRCWGGRPDKLDNSSISCSRFKHGVPPRASSGLGRFKGGDVKTATNDGPTQRGWAVGDGQGEDVEIFLTPDARASDLSGDGDVTLGKILYFFDIEGNQRADTACDSGPIMEFVLVYEYVTCGVGRSRKPEHATKHPTYWLRGGRAVVPSVFPVDAIRRHVQMSHLCPVSSFENKNPSPLLSCGLRDEEGGRVQVWRHRYNLAATDQAGTHRGDAYMLNEHWRNVFQDGVV